MGSVLRWTAARHEQRRHRDTFRAAVTYSPHNVFAGQSYYDFLVDYIGYSKQADTLTCLSQIPQRLVLMGQYMKIFVGCIYNEALLAGETAYPENPSFVRSPSGVVFMRVSSHVVKGLPFWIGYANELTTHRRSAVPVTRVLVLETVAYTGRVGIPLLGPILVLQRCRLLTDECITISVFTVTAFNLATNLDPKAASGLAHYISGCTGTHSGYPTLPGFQFCRRYVP
ncbi:hypothetical protein DAEQUDRAFT_740256 [Daedalea quercina L-15889]|uniref:Uncharacterized protein n=1 Tax=Daedalea quercina L-15889 TaxID=1314783 RepID=A0A165MT38_9APHY|nr:hypothetical protein DAEQUDRAFT_740256 [Daedalea quercina L-15889]